MTLKIENIVHNRRTTVRLIGGKDNPEARLVAHHTGVRFCGTFQGNRFDHRTNVLEDAECQGILDLNGGAGQASLK